MILSSQVPCNHRVGIPVVAYTRERCPRCLGKNYYGGFVVDRFGRFATEEGSDALNTQIQKILTERKRRDSQYGFDYNILSGGVIDPSVTPAIVAEISRCLSYLKFLQKKEQAYGVGFRPSELIDTIDDITVTVDSADPRQLIISVTVITEARTTVTEAVPLRR